MKNNRVKKLMASAVILLAGLAFAVSSYAQENNTQEKIRLMVEAVKAKDSGDFALAKSNLEEILKISPEDKSVQSLLLSVNDSIVEAEAEKVQAEAAEAARVQAEAAEAAEVARVEAEAAKEAELMGKALQRQDNVLVVVNGLIKEAKDYLENDNVAAATTSLNTATEKLDSQGGTSADIEKARASINELYAEIAITNAQVALDAGNFDEANALADDFALRTNNSKRASNLKEKISEYSDNPYKNTLESVSSEDSLLRQKEVKNLIKKGKIQYLYGSYEDAIATFRNIETLDPQNMEVKTYLSLLASRLSEIGMKTYEATRKQMLAEVNSMWQLPVDYQGAAVSTSQGSATSPIAAKLEDIIIDEVNFNDVPLSRVINNLSILSQENDKSNSAFKGVNIAMIGKDDDNTVSLSLRNAPLGQILYLATRQVGYTYEIQDNVVLVTKGSADASVLSLETEFFDVPSTVLNNRMLGLKATTSSTDSSDPFATSSSSSDSADSSDAEVRSERLLKFLTRNGVPFGPGTSVSCEESSISVTNTPANIQKVLNIINRYTAMEQVEVEAKFMEVNQGALDMLAFNYNISRYDAVKDRTEILFQTDNRLISSTIAQTNAGETPTTVISGASTVGQDGDVTVKYTSEEYPQTIPSLPSSINLASNALQTANAILGVINGFSADIMIDALSQEQGTDLLTAPRLTVVDNGTATIRVAQEMRYPTEFTDVQSDVGSGDSYTGSSGVTITPGTPSNFQPVDIGITMEITPSIQKDSSILVTLNPMVTEFEGFMEYGGLAVAISGYTTVTVPSGFIQPVFAIREISTSVYIFDGATIVLGGLVREEVKTVNDGVPFLMDIPLLGTFFRSKGEARQKKNLLIFVTANRVTPGGSLRSALFTGANSDGIYQSPVVRSPGGIVSRLREAPVSASN